MPRWHVSVVVLVEWLVVATGFAAEAIEFNRDIRPILSEKCFTCHGPDSQKREADLRLDTEHGLVGARDGKAIIVAGEPEQSELFRRLTSTDDDVRMPPPDSKKSVSPEQVALIRRWISEGAKYQLHWSLLPPRRIEPPSAGEGWARNSLDRFLAAGHAQRGLEAAPDADRRTLARRLHFDLLGLPPSSEVVEAFARDESAGAYEGLVDRLLASPHFGERMAMYWLDVVRYADSGGYHSDNERELSPFRDYVIRAFNENMPFDQFTREQIAGDLLPQATTQQKVASGYNRLLQTTEEGGAQPKEYTAKYMADRVRNTATAWIAMTLGCSECHDHKYDPFTARDFYSFGAFFADIEEKAVGRQDQVALPTIEQERQLAKLDDQLRPLLADIHGDHPELAADQARWEEQTRLERNSGNLTWVSPVPEKLATASGTALLLQDDQSVLLTGDAAVPEKETYTVTLKAGSYSKAGSADKAEPAEPADKAQPSTVSSATGSSATGSSATGSSATGLRLELLPPSTQAVRSPSPPGDSIVLSELEVSAQPSGNGKPRPVKIKASRAGMETDGHPILHAIDGKSETGWVVSGQQSPRENQAVFEFERPIPAGTTLVVKIRCETPDAGHAFRRFRIALTAAEQPMLSDQPSLPLAVWEAVSSDRSAQTAEQRETLRKYYRAIAPELATLRQQIAPLLGRRRQIEQSYPLTLVSISRTPREVRILPRGNWLDDSGELVAPATPKVLPGVAIEKRELARLELGHWLASRDNPLTARVFVNRLWKQFFGQGIVRTLDDFGTQGAAPTHPELLDWLALDFMDSGWNVKQTMKRIVMSRAYGQSAKSSPLMTQRDPLNQWLARQASWRLDAELVRDNALAISGLLTTKIGGPSARPYQPAGYWRFLNFPVREWENDRNENQYRRGLYTHWQRTFPHPSMVAFDAPSREECTVERPRSNTPLQALVLLNDPTYVEAARVFAARILAEGGTTAKDRLEYAFRRALSRAPSNGESDVLLALLTKHLNEYQADPARATDLLKVGEFPPSNVPPSELAAWTSVARAILNLHETITRS